MLVLLVLAVAPLAGAWIEIGTTDVMRGKLLVAPLAGAWIEIRMQDVQKTRI